MNKLIDANVLIQNLSVNPGECPGCPEPEFLNDLIKILKAAPTVDAVPVQRCDGCRYADWHSNGCIAYCTKHEADGFVADDYCSYGKKDGEQHGTK